jgi:V/A-type H+/Na+-transporting ATPase subunit D
MALKFQYNKTYLHQLSRELQVRENALPTLTAKEAALRLEVHKALQEVQRLEQELSDHTEALAKTYPLWHELPEKIITVAQIQVVDKKIAGVKVPQLEHVIFSVDRYSLFNQPSWVPVGIERLRELAELSIRIDLVRRKKTVLEQARKKTTQKVNLYEKVQIPAYRDGILKIRRFLEDEESLAKSAQKILKARLAREEAA